MNPAQLLSHFDRIGEAPDAIPRLRRFILDLAVRGKLVEQDPRDEPASKLLERIQEVKTRWVKNAEIRKENLLPQIDLQPYKIPKGWEWTRLGNIGRIFNGNSVSESEKINLSKVTEGYPFIATKDVGYGRDVLAYENGIRVPFDAAGFKVAHSQAVLICSEGGSAGKKVGLADRDVCFGNKLYANEVWHGIHPRYILALYQTTSFFKEFSARMTGIIGGIARSGFLLLPIPIPPESEQNRIVAKVDELMGLCDRLEAAQTERESRRDRLVASSLHHLNNGADADAFQEDARFYFNHLPRLTTRPDHIKQLRQTILNLAVRGKLLEQDPTDEPAIKMLERAQLANRAKLKEQINKFGTKGGPSRTAKLANRYGKLPVPNTQGLTSLPTSWAWVCWESILDFGEGTFKRGPFGSALTKSIFVTSGYKVYEQYCPINDDCSFARYFITPQKFKELEGFAVKAGDFLISCSGVTLGRITQVPDKYEEGVINQALLRVRTDKHLIQDSFFKMLFRSPYFQKQIFTNSTGMAIPNVKGVAELKAIPLPLPPLAEQHRIVAKVDELMALCDQLETQLTTTQSESRHLLESLLHESLTV